MFYKIKSITPQKNYIINIRFINGITKSYDVSKLFSKYPMFKKLEDEEVYYSCTIDVGGYAIIWDDSLDISCNELWNNGIVIETPFDNLLSFNDATSLWNLNESTLRKAVNYGKFVLGIDVLNFGHQWLITYDAMKREYGDLK